MSHHGYNGEIPLISRRAATMKSTPPSSLSIPSAGSSTSSNDSYIQTTFRDFASHAKRCERCCDPLGSHLKNVEMCPRGRHLAKIVTSSLFDEANEKYKESHKKSSRSSRKDDGWQALEVDVPKGCEVVRNLFTAIESGLVLPSTPASSSPRSPSSKSSNVSNSSYEPRPVLGETWDYVPASRESRSDEGRESRRHHRDEEKHHRSRSAGGHHHHRRHRSDETVGVEERERRPYGHSSRSSHDDVSVDSGYSTTSGGCPSPDIGRGSQFAKDMERRNRAKGSAATIPRSALKKAPSNEHLHPDYYKHSRVPSSPRLGKGAGVGFNIEGHYYVPGYP